MKETTKNNLKILGLEQKEEEIIRTLKEFGTMRPVDLARKTLIKRTTINFLLNKLLARGLVKKAKIKNHYEWSINSEDHLKIKIDLLYKYFCAFSAEGIINIPPEVSVEVFKGRKKVLEAYERVLKAGRNNRVYAIQGNKSIEATKNLEKSYLSDIQKKFKNNKIIIEGIVGQDSLAFFDSLDYDTLKAYENRLVVAYIIDDKLIDYDMDILIFKKIVMLINFENNTAVVIKNQAIYEVFLHLFEVMRIISQKIDLNKYILDLIKKRQYENNR